ncbi:MAG: type VI secretion system tube protein Hcp [Proteobacteria bacterium]|nr:type VI secretion system tube protein Hcp [Pseudomonadota bacterium]
MATMNFMKVDGADGDSNDQGHKNWIDIEPFSISASNQGSFAIGSGGNVGGADHHDLTIHAVLDKAMPVIFYQLATGDTVPTVKLEACKMSNKKQVVFESVELKNVMFTGINTGSGTSANGQPMVTYTFTYESIKKEYTPLKADGNPGAKVTAGWNAAKNIKL